MEYFSRYDFILKIILELGRAHVILLEIHFNIYSLLVAVSSSFHYQHPLPKSFKRITLIVLYLYSRQYLREILERSTLVVKKLNLWSSLEEILGGIFEVWMAQVSKRTRIRGFYSKNHINQCWFLAPHIRYQEDFPLWSLS